jgi:hypothetical protein
MVEPRLMTALADALAKFQRQSSPPEASMSNPFKLVSTLDGPARANEVGVAWRGHGLPCDALDLWAACRQARLFEDVDYGQWGLALPAPSASATRTAQEHAARPAELRPDDIVLGEFLGDQELLVLAPSETGRRRILIARPLDRRADWLGVAQDLAEFLERYFDHAGDKDWERPHVGAEPEER